MRPAATAGLGAVRPHKQAELAVAPSFGIADIEYAELDRSEVDLPAIIIDFFRADEFAREAIRQVPLRVAKGDDAVRIPRRIHHTASRDKPPAARVENGAPLSVVCGNPYSRKADSKTGRACAKSGRVNAWHRRR